MDGNLQKALPYTIELLILGLLSYFNVSKSLENKILSRLMSFWYVHMLELLSRARIVF